MVDINIINTNITKIKRNNMYIRRKLYSTFEDENGEERLFSTTEFIDEDQYLDEALYSDYSDE
jgi:hypothetical protein